MEELNSSFRYIELCALDIPKRKIAKLFASSGDTDQMLHALCLQCLPITLLGSPD